MKLEIKGETLSKKGGQRNKRLYDKSQTCKEKTKWKVDNYFTFLYFSQETFRKTSNISIKKPNAGDIGS